MFYHLFKYLDLAYDLPGARLFSYISFRAGVGIVLSLLIGLLFGKKIIQLLQRKLVGEEIRDLGLEDQLKKKGTPTMGGIIILIAILVPTLLLADLTNMYTWLMIISTIWLGFLGFLDDYIKVFKKNKEGLHGKFKIVGQVGLGIIVSLTLALNQGFVVRDKLPSDHPQAQKVVVGEGDNARNIYLGPAHKSTTTTIPFFKNNEFDYQMVVPKFFGDYRQNIGWLMFMIVTTFIITAVSNGANLTDGMDGLASGVSIVIGVTLGILAYLSGNVIYADYLQIMYIPNSGELVIFMSSVIGALIGFLWYNTYPAHVFMGDTGSLALGGIIAVFAIIIRKELLIPILCGIFFVESLSVVIQVTYFRHTKRKYGEGKRVFLMAPLHHHYQKKGFPEPKIVVRFWIIAALLAVVSILTLKVR
ncbi:MAG: phospho-N-acetylmuramoyl-pentapeptide-transferase [Prevotellaceae bacterium]|jgi:phospho-N-acetylmuramoyl-pentapeptide-transferase|nr:phospho-N-acetylmuramoyl-pentapeptide-transferase [Prevotellaceae bacterium]